MHFIKDYDSKSLFYHNNFTNNCEKNLKILKYFDILISENLFQNTLFNTWKRRVNKHPGVFKLTDVSIFYRFQGINRKIKIFEKWIVSIGTEVFCTGYGVVLKIKF